MAKSPSDVPAGSNPGAAPDADPNDGTGNAGTATLEQNLGAAFDDAEDAPQGDGTETPGGPEAEAATAAAAKPAEAKPAATKPLTPEQLTEQTQALETRTQELRQYEDRLSEVYEEVRGILANPKFRAAYKQIAGHQTGLEPGAAPNAGAKAPGGEAQAASTEDLLKQLETFNPETDNETMLQNVAKAALTDLVAARKRLDGLDERVKRHDEDFQTRATADADSAIERAKAPLKEQYGDLFDDGKREDEWEGLAASLREAAELQGKPMTTDQALDLAAKVLLRDTIKAGAVKTVKDAAARAAAAGTETPGRGTGRETLTLEQRLGKAFDEAKPTT